MDEELQYNKIVLMLGDIGLKKWQKFNLSADDRKDPAKVFKAYRDSLGNDISFRTARSTLYRNFQQGKSETIHELDLRLSKLVDECAFPTDEIKQHIKLDILVHSTRYYEVKRWCNTQEDTGEHKLTYDVLKRAKEHEAAVREYKKMAEDNPTLTTAYMETKQQVAVDAIHSKGKHPRHRRDRRHSRSRSGSRDRARKPSTKSGYSKKPCYNCGYKEHTKPDGSCPAKGHNCGYCGKPNHFETVCIKKKQDAGKGRRPGSPSHSSNTGRGRRRDQTPRRAAVDSVQINTASLSDQFHRIHFDSVSTTPRKQQVLVDAISTLDTDKDGKTFVLADIDVHLPHREHRDTMRVKVDMGAESNILPIRIYGNMFPHQMNLDGTPALQYLQQANLEFKAADTIIDSPGCICRFACWR